MNKLIGNTPMIKIFYKYKDKIDAIYVKLEYYNLTGSIKDRMVFYILDKSKKDGILKDNMPIIEATSGNTGISLAAYGAKNNHPVVIYMPDFVSIERRKLMEMFGAKVITYKKEEGGFERCIKEAQKEKEKQNGFSTNQFDNINNPLSHYDTTAKEIEAQLNKIEYFVSGIGTGGTLMGVGSYLKEKYNTKIIALEPATMSLLTNGIKESHKIEGIGDEFIPSIIKKQLIDDVIVISDIDAINMSDKIAKELGIGVGISSGANLLASILIKKAGNVVTVFPDDNKKYLTTDLYNNSNKDKSLVSNQITLIDYEIVK